MSDAPLVGVVTVTYNSALVLDEFLASLRSQTHEQLRLYVVDNASADDTLARLQASNHPATVIANDRNVGVAAGNNQGILAALSDGCEQVLMLNNDTVFGSELVADLLQAQRLFGADLVTPRITYHDRPDLIWFAGGDAVRHLGFRARVYGFRQPVDAKEVSTARLVPFAATCCLLISAEVFQTIGLMDEDFFVYGDDTDFCLRVGDAGFNTVYVPNPILRHKVSSLTGGLLSPFTVRYATIGKVLLLRKHSSRLETAFWLQVFRLYYLALFAARRFDRTTLKGYLAALAEGRSLPLDNPRGTVHPPCRRSFLDASAIG